MIDQKYIELINQEIDGVITPKQKSMLDNYLKKNPQAEKLYQELIATSKIIDQIPAIEPSENLKKRIMNSIDFNRYSEESKIKWIANQNMEWIFNPKSKMAIAFVLGMIVAFLFLTPFWLYDAQEKITNDTDFYGTIMMDQVNELKSFKQIDLDLNFIQGVISFKRLDQLFILELDIDCSDQTELVFEYDPNILQLMDIKLGTNNQKIQIVPERPGYGDEEP